MSLTVCSRYDWAGVLIGGGLQPPGGWQGSSQQDRVPRGRLVTIDSGQQETPSWGCSTQKDTVTRGVVQAAVLENINKKLKKDVLPDMKRRGWVILSKRGGMDGVFRGLAGCCKGNLED